MKLLRERAQQHFPTVLLTLLSIVQALALELLWEHIQETDYLFEANWNAMISWLQIVATLMGIILIWVTYASNAMRFSWVPSTSDSIYPFIIGLLEFAQIETLNPQMIGQWSVLMGVIFACMVMVSQHTLRRARISGDNGDYFTDVSPANFKDFLPHAIVIAVLLIGGLVLWINHITGVPALVLVLANMVLLLWQYVSAARFWQNSIAD